MNPGMAERRSNERYPTHLNGLIAGEPTHAPIECTVWDLSKTGARLVFSEPADIPLEFQLQIPDQGATARVQLIWTDGIHYGATFTD